MNRFRTLVAGSAAAIAMTLLIATPASAHDQLISSDPEAGTTVEVTPTQIELTYNANVLELGAVIELVSITDGIAGTPVELGEPTVTATVVTAEILGDMPSADYEARWRVVSSDGHPIDGVVAFTLDAPATETPEPTPSSEPTTEQPTEPTASATAEATDAPAPSVTDAPENAADSEDGDAGTMLPALLIGGGVLLAAVGAVAAFFMLRRRGTGDVR